MGDITLTAFHKKMDEVQKGFYDKIDHVSSNLSKKMDSLQNTVSDVKVSVAERPCDTHEEKFLSQEKSINRLWVFNGIVYTVIFGALIGLAFK